MRWQFPRSLIVSTGNVTVFNFCLNCRPECYAKLVQGDASVSCVGAAGAGGEMLMSPFWRRGGSAS